MLYLDVKRWLQTVAIHLPPRLTFLLSLRSSARQSWGGPFNGQLRRQEMVAHLLRTLPFRAVVETGTYRGETTAFLRKVSGLPVFSVERNRYFFGIARRRFGDDPGVQVVLSDSRHALRSWAGDEQLAGPTLFYLDAHWSEDVPLRDELSIIHQGWTDWVAIVDDFKVPDDPGYGYDQYREVSLELDYLRLDRLAPIRVFWPSARSESETGARRGCAVLVPIGPLVAKVSEVPHLRSTPRSG
jgi:hypothetical protein